MMPCCFSIPFQNSTHTFGLHLLCSCLPVAVCGVNEWIHAPPPLPIRELTHSAHETFDSRESAVTSRQHSVQSWFTLVSSNAERRGSRAEPLIELIES